MLDLSCLFSRTTLVGLHVAMLLEWCVQDLTLQPQPATAGKHWKERRDCHYELGLPLEID